MKLTPIPLPSKFVDMCFAIKKVGGKAYLAGGIVRDHLLGYPAKDIDVEVHHLDPSTLILILKQYGNPKAMGKSFGIWKLHVGKEEIDVSLPKKEKNIDINLGIEQSCRRRDLRLNAILYDPTTQQFHDPFLGIQDIKDRILQATDPFYFSQDPLRVFRVAQFASRFQFSVSNDLIQLCQQQDLSNIASERVLAEFEKCWIKSPKPSIGIQYFIQLQVIEKYFPTWPGLQEHSVQTSLDTGKQYCTDHLGWNMALFWALSLQKCSPTQAEQIMDTLKIFTYHNFNVREAVLYSIHYATPLASKNDHILRNQAAEDFRLDFLCTVGASISPQGYSLDNLEQAKLTGIDRNPLPKIIQGRNLLKLGISGRMLGECLKFIRTEQLQGRINTTEEALQKAKDWMEQ